MVANLRINLEVPTRTAPPPGHYLSDLRQVQAWRDQLPLANIGETSHQIFSALKALNRINLPAEQRLKTAEVFREPLEHVARNLEKRYLDADFPLSERAHRTAELNVVLHSELALAYVVAAQEINAQSAARPDSHSLAVALYRALAYTSKRILIATTTYEPYPASSWRLVHELYVAAQDAGNSKASVTDELELAGWHSTIATLYKRILLFSLAEPYNLRPREMLAVYSHAEEWAEALELWEAGLASEATPQYVVSVASDSPPYGVEFASPDSQAKGFWLLDTSRLVDRLRHSLDHEHSAWDTDPVASPERGPSPSLVKHLLRVWSRRPRRQFTRTNRNVPIELAVGLGTIHELLQRRALGDPQDEEELVTCGDVVTKWDPQIHIDAQQRNQTHYCRTCNESAGGLCIDWEHCDLPRIKVGELVAIRYSPQANQFSLGIVRWLRESSTSRRLRAGIELIAPNVQAVVCRPVYADSPGYSQCLLLPELEGAGIPPSVVTPPYPFRIGDRVAVRDAETVLRLTRLVRSSAAFRQFQYAMPTDESFDARTGQGTGRTEPGSSRGSDMGR